MAGKLSIFSFAEQIIVKIERLNRKKKREPHTHNNNYIVVNLPAQRALSTSESKYRGVMPQISLNIKIFSHK